jgi:hypothetical protein
MGQVFFSTYYRITGIYEPVENVHAYVYCDECGSFALDYHIHPYTTKQKAIRNGAIIASPCLAIFAWLIAHNWIICCVLAVFAGITFLGTTHGKYLKCKKCGNEHITDANVLHYSDNDESVFDVPNELIIKRFIHSIVS